MFDYSGIPFFLSRMFIYVISHRKGDESLWSGSSFFFSYCLIWVCFFDGRLDLAATIRFLLFIRWEQSTTGNIFFFVALRKSSSLYLEKY